MARLDFSHSLLLEVGRIETFHRGGWSVPFVGPEDLAASGFAYTGTNDVVQCVYCGSMIGDWQYGYEMLESVRHYGHCPYFEEEVRTVAAARGKAARAVVYARGVPPEFVRAALVKISRGRGHRFPVQPREEALYRVCMDLIMRTRVAKTVLESVPEKFVRRAVEGRHGGVFTTPEALLNRSAQLWVAHMKDTALMLESDHNGSSSPNWTLVD